MDYEELCTIQDKILGQTNAVNLLQSGDQTVSKFIGGIVEITQPKIVLELGRGIGLTTLHMLKSLPKNGRLISIENDIGLFNEAPNLIGKCSNLELLHADGEQFLEQASHEGAKFDLIFADA